MEARNKMNGKPVFTVPAKSIINFKSGFKAKLLCDGVTFTAGSACAYSCTFCYVENMMTKSTHFQGAKEQNPGIAFENVVIRRVGAIEAMRKELLNAKGRPKYLKDDDKRVIYASPLVDVAANMELVCETVEMCISILFYTNWQIRLLSKSNLLPKIAQALDEWNLNYDHDCKPRKRIIYGVSTGTLDDGLAKVFEKGTPLVSKRIESLHWLQDNGFRTFGMICPSLPQDNYEKFAADMAGAIRAEKCEHIWAEVMNARGESFTRTFDALMLAGYKSEAEALREVSTNKTAWNQYSRDTFWAHRIQYHGQKIDGQPKLRFLQYASADQANWWKDEIEHGAVML